MMYEFPALEAELTQGDIIDDCPILSWTNLQSSDSTQWELGQSKERIIVLTQACDLANAKTTKVQVAIVHDAQRLVQAQVLKPAQIRYQVRMHRVFGLYFLPESNPAVSESIVDLRATSRCEKCLPSTGDCLLSSVFSNIDRTSRNT